MTPLRHHHRIEGFTLVELLVATAVFVVGFAAVFALFLSGMRFRKLADDTTLTATLASSLLTEVYLDSARMGLNGPAQPLEYGGDGHGDSAAPSDWRDTKLFAYTGVPGTSFRIAGPPGLSAPPALRTARGNGACCDILGEQDPMATVIVADVIALCPGARLDTLGDLDRRLHIDTPSQRPAGWDALDDASKAVAYENELVARGIALRYRAAMIRQPHWMFTTP